MSQGQTLARQPASYYGGPLTVGQTGAETAAWNTRDAYNSSVFGGAPSPEFGDLTSAVSSQLNGGGALGGMAGQISPYATSSILNSFGPTNTNGIAGIQSPGATNAAGQIGNYGFGTSLDPSGRAPQFGVAGNLDARGVYSQMLNDGPDYGGVQGAIDAANAPILRQFENEILPSLNQRATFTNNQTGGIKSLNRVLPEIGERMGENAQNIMNAERLRSLDARERAAGAVSQGGFQGYGLGLSTAQGERGLEQNLANMGLNTDSTRAGLMLSDFGTGLSGAQLGLQREGMLTDSADRYRADLLNLGSLGGQLSSNAGGQQLQAAGLFPSVYNLGRQPGTDALEYANYDRALREDALGADQDRFNYMRDQPYNNLGWYSGLISGTASPYGTATTTGPKGSRAAGALGGAMFGGQMGSQMFNNNPWATGIGALLGGLGGYYG